MDQEHFAQVPDGELADGVVFVEGVDRLGCLLFFEMPVIAYVAHRPQTWQYTNQMLNWNVQLARTSNIISCLMQSRYYKQMYFYAIPSGIVFGGFMYFLGSLGLLHEPHHHHRAPRNAKTAEQDPL